LDAETMLFALRGESLPATQVLGGSGGGLNDEQRLAAIVEKLKASSPLVRYEAVRAYIRRGVKTLGCQPLVDAIDDPDSHVPLRAAAILAKAAPAEANLSAALVNAVLPLTREGKETSRDGRLALLDALEIHGRATDVPALEPLLRDFDPRVAGVAAALLTKLG